MSYKIPVLFQQKIIKKKKLQIHKESMKFTIMYSLSFHSKFVWYIFIYLLFCHNNESQWGPNNVHIDFHCILNKIHSLLCCMTVNHTV